MVTYILRVLHCLIDESGGESSRFCIEIMVKGIGVILTIVLKSTC